MLETISAEIMYYRERARLAREKADAATTIKAKNDHLGAEARWFALARSYELQNRLSKTLGADARKGTREGRETTVALDPEVVGTLSTAFHAAFAELGLSDNDEVIALRVARRMIKLAVQGERDPERLRAVVLAWVAK
jgi:hypothetical protein